MKKKKNIQQYKQLLCQYRQFYQPNILISIAHKIHKASVTTSLFMLYTMILIQNKNLLQKQNIFIKQFEQTVSHKKQQSIQRYIQIMIHRKIYLQRYLFNLEQQNINTTIERQILNQILTKIQYYYQQIVSIENRLIKPIKYKQQNTFKKKIKTSHLKDKQNDYSDIKSLKLQRSTIHRNSTKIQQPLKNKKYKKYNNNFITIKTQTNQQKQQNKQKESKQLHKIKKSKTKFKIDENIIFKKKYHIKKKNKMQRIETQPCGIMKSNKSTIKDYKIAINNQTSLHNIIDKRQEINQDNQNNTLKIYQCNEDNQSCDTLKNQKHFRLQKNQFERTSNKMLNIRMGTKYYDQNDSKEQSNNQQNDQCLEKQICQEFIEDSEEIQQNMRNKLEKMWIQKNALRNSGIKRFSKPLNTGKKHQKHTYFKQSSDQQPYKSINERNQNIKLPHRLDKTLYEEDQALNQRRNGFKIADRNKQIFRRIAMGGIYAMKTPLQTTKYLQSNSNIKTKKNIDINQKNDIKKYPMISQKLLKPRRSAQLTWAQHKITNNQKNNDSISMPFSKYIAMNTQQQQIKIVDIKSLRQNYVNFYDNMSSEQYNQLTKPKIIDDKYAMLPNRQFFIRNKLQNIEYYVSRRQLRLQQFAKQLKLIDLHRFINRYLINLEQQYIK